MSDILKTIENYPEIKLTEFKKLVIKSGMVHAVNFYYDIMQELDEHKLNEEYKYTKYFSSKELLEELSQDPSRIKTLIDFFDGLEEQAKNEKPAKKIKSNNAVKESLLLESIDEEITDEITIVDDKPALTPSSFLAKP